MSYNYNGQQIRVMQPVHSISVNQNRMAIKDEHGLSYVTFSSSSDLKQFISWLSRN